MFRLRRLAFPFVLPPVAQQSGSRGQRRCDSGRLALVFADSPGKDSQRSHLAATGRANSGACQRPKRRTACHARLNIRTAGVNGGESPDQLSGTVDRGHTRTTRRHGSDVCPSLKSDCLPAGQQPRGCFRTVRGSIWLQNALQSRPIRIPANCFDKVGVSRKRPRA